MSKLSPKEVEEVRKEAKHIMDSFMKKLESVEKELNKISDDEIGVSRDDFEREEGKNSVLNIDRDVMFENAPKKNKDFIIAEKKGW